MKAKLLLLTNPANAQEGEDEFLAQALGTEFNIKLVSNENVLEFMTCVDGVLIRNNWPAFGEEERFWGELHSVYDTLRSSNIPCYTDLSALGDMQGKSYLNKMMRAGLPVIPTALDVSELDSLPQSARYLIKPYFGGDSWRLEVLERNALLEKDLSEYVIQPFVQIVKEVHYVFIDNTFVYAFAAQSRREDPMPADIHYYQPGETELQFASQFTHWNTFSHGLQRIDVVETSGGTLLLNELEDHCPYLWLKNMPEVIQTRLIEALSNSLKAWCALRAN